ncbi:MAG: hypothetical protein WC910_10460 [Bacteroidales bacterium]|jgi:hypothetical protein
MQSQDRLTSETFKAFQFYEDHPVEFAEEVLGVQLDEWQKEALNNLQEFHYLAIRSGSGVGKTFLLGIAIIWFISTKPFCKIPTTAPSQHQLYDLLWSELFNRISRSPFLQGYLNWTQTRLTVRGYDAVWYAVARTAQVSPSGEVAEGLQGFHAEDNLLFVVDESSGVPDAIFPAMEGALTGKNSYALLTGNPTKTSGYFFDVFNNPKLGAMYKKMHVSCLDSSRVESRYVDMMKERYGEKHPIYLIKVLGEFPSGGINALIPYSYLETAQNNKKDTFMSPKMSHEIGVDVGRSQASSILVVRQGFNIVDFAEKHKPGRVTDTAEISQWVSEYITAYNPSSVKIDAIFNPGVFDTLHNMWGDLVVPVIGGQRSNYPERFLNLRAEACWEFRELVPKLWCKEWPARLIREMTDVRLKESVRRDVIQVESKKDMLNRAMASPDFFDATVYAFLSPESCIGVPMQEPFTFSQRVAQLNGSFVKDGGSMFRRLSDSNNPVNRWRQLH